MIARRKREERVIVLAGLVGLGASAAYACGGAAPPAAAPVVANVGPSPAACARDPRTAENTAAVVKAVDALLAALTPEQRIAIQVDRTLAVAAQWSNFPAGVVKRNGVKLGDMTPAAEAAALALVRVAAGEKGATLLEEIRLADDENRGNDEALFGHGNYYVSVHGKATADAPWMLQIAGHHLAYDFTYGGACTSATPLFAGVQPSTWKDARGAVHVPLEPQRAALGALLASLGSSPDARLTGTFTDMINGPSSLGGGGGPPGGGPRGPRGPRPDGGPGGPPHGGPPRGPMAGGNDSNYPAKLVYPAGTTGRGVNAGSLSPAQRGLLKAAIATWVETVAEPVSTSLAAAYESDEALAQTYIGYSGAADLSTSSSYARIDGPRIWIELTVQDGTAGGVAGHYHAIWRDKASDYGAEYVSR